MFSYFTCGLFDHWCYTMNALLKTDGGKFCFRLCFEYAHRIWSKDWSRVLVQFANESKKKPDATQVVGQLLQARDGQPGIDIDAKNSEGRTAVFYAADYNQLENVKQCRCRTQETSVQIDSANLASEFADLHWVSNTSSTRWPESLQCRAVFKD